MAICEEMIFRGLLFKYLILDKRSSLIKAIFLSSFFFSITHIPSLLINFDSINSAISLIIFSFFIGIVLACLTYMRKSIILPAVIHIIFNINSVPNKLLICLNPEKIGLNLFKSNMKINYFEIGSLLLIYSPVILLALLLINFIKRNAL
jgi:membrane protease YdiL (CAAX protease family)